MRLIYGFNVTLLADSAVVIATVVVAKDMKCIYTCFRCIMITLKFSLKTTAGNNERKGINKMLICQNNTVHRQ